MDRKGFWRLIRSSQMQARDLAGMPNVLRAKLEKRSRKEIQDYARIFGELMAESYDWGLWGAAEIMKSGASDDGFDYFRCWLIAMGETVYTRAVVHPDTLADVVEPMQEGNFELEDMLYVPVHAWETKTGEELDDPNPARNGYRSAPKGKRLKKSQLPKLYPRLTERFRSGRL